MNCTRCNSSRLYQFVASSSVKVEAKPLPVVCRDCGLISLGGHPVELPEALEQQAMEIATAAEQRGKQAQAELEGEEPTKDRIAQYFENVYRSAYLDGFFRCLAFYRHNMKEGRLHRLRDLWKRTVSGRSSMLPAKGQTMVRMPTEAYTEFVQLLHLSAVPGETNAQGHPNQYSSKTKNPS